MNKTEIYTTYAPDTGITVILEDTRDEQGNTTSTELKGFYHGSPNDNDTKAFYGKIRAEYLMGKAEI